MQSVEEADAPSAPDAPRAPRRPHLSLPALAETATYALAILCIVWPGVLQARHEMLGAGDDARYYTWLGWRIGRQIAHGHLVPMRIADVIVPFGLDLRLLDGYLPSYVSGLFNLVVGPFLAYNLTFIAGAVLNIVAARALVRRLSPLRLVHTITAVAFLTAPPIALNVQLGLLPLFWAFTVPLLLADALDVVTGARGVRPIRLALLLAVAYLCSVYFLVFGGLAYGLIVGIAMLRRRRWRIALETAGALALTLLMLLPFVVPRIRFNAAEEKRGANTLLLADSKLFSADALSIVAQPTRSTFLFPRPAILKRSLVRLPDRRSALETTIFPGLLLLIGLGVFLVRRDPRRLPLVLTALATWVLCLGPSLKVGGHYVWRRRDGPVSRLPYRVLLAVPALGALRVPNRIGEVLVGVCAAATAIALHRVLSGTRRKIVVAVAAASAVLLATNLLIPLPTTTMGTTAASERALREIGRLAHRGDTVLRVPSDCDPAVVSYQVFHHARVLGCAGSFAANPWLSKLRRYAQSEAFTKLRCDRAEYGRIPTSGNPAQPFGERDTRQLRKDFGVRFLVVDRTLLGPLCRSVAASLPFLEAHRSLGGDRRFEVIDLSAPAGR